VVVGVGDRSSVAVGFMGDLKCMWRGGNGRIAGLDLGCCHAIALNTLKLRLQAMSYGRLSCTRFILDDITTCLDRQFIHFLVKALSVHEPKALREWFTTHDNIQKGHRTSELALHSGFWTHRS
jgi:hypothetical protein